MPSAKGLSHRATVESGVAIKVADRGVAIRNAELLLRKLGIASIDVHRIQDLPIEQIMSAYFDVCADLGGVDLNVASFAPSVDRGILPQHPFDPRASPVSAGIPVMIGHTRTEWTGLTTDASLWNLDELRMESHVNKMLGHDSADIISLYRKQNPGATPSDLFFLIASDYHYGAPTMKIAERRAALNKSPVYLYYFTWATPVQDGQLQTPHNMDIPFAFDYVQISASLTGGGPDAMALADRVSDTWIAFARTGNPNNPKLPEWPQFDAKKRATMVFNNEIQVVDDPLKEQREAMFRALNLS